MRAVCLAAVFVFGSSFGFAQGPPTLPPVAPDPSEGGPLAAGPVVSRPLTPIEIPQPAQPGVPAQQPQTDPVERVVEVQQQKCEPCERRGPLGSNWDSMELLLWWPKAAPVPPLVTASRTGAVPVLGDPNTALLVGGHSLGTPVIAGGRFTWGWAMNEAQTVGFELSYFFLGSRTNRVTITDIGDPRIRSLGLPFFDATTGRESVFITAAPNVSVGSAYVTTTTRMQGAEANAVANLVDAKRLRLNGLVGYRFLQVNEGLTIEQMRYTNTAFGPIYDQFDGHNRFHGGQLGLHADLGGKWVFCEFTGKVALGQTFEVVKIDGATNIYTPVLGGVSQQHYPGGVYALTSNIGRYTRGAFAVVPEGTLKLGLKVGDSGRFYVGYNFLYLSEAVRAGDQLDRVLNPGHIPTINPGGVAVGLDRPRVPFARSDFWAQGLIIGLETRY